MLYIMPANFIIQTNKTILQRTCTFYRNKFRLKQNSITFHQDKQKMQNTSNQPPKQNLNVDNTNNYEDQLFDKYDNTNNNANNASSPLSYTSQIQQKFPTIANYQQHSYQNLQQETSQMRQLYKKMSKILDQKIHKYYGLMGVKNIVEEKDVQIFINKLNKELDANKKLQMAQQSQIKDIQQVDQEMSSSKRIQKQAQRLRQYFQTKKSMITAQKQSRFSKGQVSKLGQYLARDLDVQKLYFKFNQIKESFEYAILKDRNLSAKIQQLDNKYLQMSQKLNKMSVTYTQKVNEAYENGIVIQQNKSMYVQYHTKKQLIKKLKQHKKKLQTLQNTFKNTITLLTTSIDAQNRQLNQKNQKIAYFEDKIAIIENQVQKMLQQYQKKDDIFKKIQQNMTLRNIQTLIKSKKQKNLQLLAIGINSANNRLRSSFVSQSRHLDPQNQVTLLPQLNNPQMRQSSLQLKPNFKIKPKSIFNISLSSRKSINKKSIQKNLSYINKSIQLSSPFLSRQKKIKPNNNKLSINISHSNDHSKRQQAKLQLREINNNNSSLMLSSSTTSNIQKRIVKWRKQNQKNYGNISKEISQMKRKLEMELKDQKNQQKMIQNDNPNPVNNSQRKMRRQTNSIQDNRQMFAAGNEEIIQQ